MLRRYSGQFMTEITSNTNSHDIPHHTAPKARSNARTEALWTEMQNTLDEVELRAERGPHIFGAAHSDALAALQNAQIALAQSWAKSEQEELAQGIRDMGEPESARPNTGTSDSVKNALEEVTENDILLAKKRREANDRYFKKVNEGVLDVIAKLEDVATTMKQVECESKELWEDGDSIDTTSVV